MSSFIVLSAGLLIGLVVIGLVPAARRQTMPSSVYSPRLGWLACGCYAGAAVAAYLVWGGSADGIGITGMLLGMPWSFVLAFGLSALQISFAQLASGIGAPVAHGLLFGTMLLNAWIVYQLGVRLPVLWTAAAPRAAR